MGHWVFNCNDISRLVSDSMDRRLPLYQRMGIRIHLMMCRYCARYRKQLFLLRRVIQFYWAPAEEDTDDIRLPDASRQRIMAAIDRHHSKH